MRPLIEQRQKRASGESRPRPPHRHALLAALEVGDAVRKLHRDFHSQLVAEGCRLVSLPARVPPEADARNLLERCEER